MDNEKIVTILLLVTIILSVLSVVVTMSANVSDRVRGIYTREIITGDNKQLGSVNLVVTSPPNGGAG